jgi:ADP-ribosylation factor GTPase-activating protein 1
MDAFKASEIERMRLGGNEGWRTFFEEHEDTKMTGVGWEDATIAERYSGEVGEEWKERLTAKVEGREFVKGETPKRVVSPPASGSARQTPRTGTPLSGTANRSDSIGSNGGTGGGKVKVDDRYFAKLGADNATRPEDLPPSQGGKYAGFGNTPGPSSGGSGGGAPTFDEVQKDPMAALTKGFGWFASTVSKTAKTVNDGYIQPTAKQVRLSSSSCFPYLFFNFIKSIFGECSHSAQKLICSL